MLKQIALSLLILGFTAGFQAAAETKIIETCQVNQSFELSEATQIFCEGDLSIQDGVEIVTNGFGLQIVSMGRVAFGNGGLGLLVSALNGPSGQVFIYARTASGNLNVNNQGEPATSFGGDVEIEFGSSFNYQQTIDPGQAAEVRMVVNGETLQLEGDRHRLPL